MPLNKRRSALDKFRPRVARRTDEVASEAGLIQRARRGERAAFELLVQRYEMRIYGLAARMMGNLDEAREITQECFTRAYRNLPRASDDLNVSSWLHRIAAGACLDVLRRRKLIRWIPWIPTKRERVLWSHPGNDRERVMIASEDSSVQCALRKMDDRYRLALMLRECEGLSTGEIGEIMGVSRSAVRSTLFRAREEFRELYRDEIGEAANRN